MNKESLERLGRPQTGKWAPGDDLPWTVQIRGKKFVRTMGLPNHDAVAQYREDQPTGSRHLYVRPDGTYIIDHRDDFNPHTHPMWHFSKDVLAAFSGEMKKQAIAGTLLAMPAKILLAASALKKQKETPRLKEMRKLLVKGDPTEVRVQETPHILGPHYDTEGSKQYVSVRKDEDPAILAHELGHSELDRETIGSVLQSRIMRLAPAAGALAGTYAARRSIPIGAAIAAAASLPIVTYEGMASERGIARMRRVGATEAEVSDAKSRLFKAWATYALLPVEMAANIATMAAIAKH